MKKDELKKILKPLIKECIREVIFEDKGALSHIISEVARGLKAPSQKKVVREQTSEERWIANAKAAAGSSSKQALLERKKKLLGAIGSDAYGGVNVFEGTTPAPSPTGNSGQGPLSGVDSNDPGVDISNLVSTKSNTIFKRMMEKK